MITMITVPEFNKKQIVFVLFDKGEKLAFSNDNLVVKTADSKIKFQCTCYRLFTVYAVGYFSLTSALIQRAKRFGFYIALMTPGFRLYALFGAEKEGNVLLKRKQYNYNELGIAKHIAKNKISNQLSVLKSVRNKSDSIKEAINHIDDYKQKIDSVSNLDELMAYEGLSSKLYFRNHFNNVLWNGRQPRVKRDMVNSTLDIGYTLLFTFIDSLLLSYGFDTYCGVMHRQFYKRKSLVCDIVEPFRPLIDQAVKKAINLNQINESDFIIINNQYKPKWTESTKIIKILMLPIIENKDKIFLYIQSYYRAFMKDLKEDNFPVFEI